MINSDSDHHGSEQFKPNTTVAIVVACGDKFLLVEEIDHGNTVYNQPAGHLEANESLITAAINESLQKKLGLLLTLTIYVVFIITIDKIIKLYYLRFCFVIELEEFTVPINHKMMKLLLVIG